MSLAAPVPKKENAALRQEHDAFDQGRALRQDRDYCYDQNKDQEGPAKQDRQIIQGMHR